ncbi:tetratricopeptide repeat protein [Leptolyngbya sp. AN02str]|uniref:tetratricopeptide repeat protein n=1 Tax=Leptolyngbya sp. AN02str TaxID=3423363 RepID=UPI003D3145C4
MKDNEQNQEQQQEQERLEQEQKAKAQTQYMAGRDAFERGRYREAIELLQGAIALVERGTALGGEMQMWLVSAYEAAGQNQEAIALCDIMTRHPNLGTRQQAKRILYILKAPRLKTRPEWLTQIPDLENLDEGDRDSQKAYINKPATPRPAKPKQKAPQDLPPLDLSQVNTKDNGFVWAALGAIALLLGGLFWFGR